MRILIIGGTGLLGGKLVEQAMGKFDVHSTYHGHIVKRPDFHRLDIANHKEAKSLIEELEPGAVVILRRIIKSTSARRKWTGLRQLISTLR